MDRISAGRKFKEEYTEEQQSFIRNVIMVTMDMCSQMLKDEIKEPITLPESTAYTAFAYETLGHVFDNEYYNWDIKEWESFND